MAGLRAWKSGNLSNSQPTAKVPTAPTVNTSFKRPPSNWPSARESRSNVSLTGTIKARPSSVSTRPRGVRRKSSKPSFSSSPFTWWLIAACVTDNSSPARVKDRCRAAASKARSALRETDESLNGPLEKFVADTRQCPLRAEFGLRHGGKLSTEGRGHE